MIYKCCSKCGLEKAVNEFHKNRNNKDSLQYQCKDCANATMRKWNHDNPERCAATAKKSYQRNNERHAASMKGMVACIILMSAVQSIPVRGDGFPHSLMHLRF